MVEGLEKFREYFTGYEEHYVLIGGVACALALEEAGAVFRPTTDLDIVLCAEAKTSDFAKHFWAFVEEGQYEHRGKSEGEKQFFRFKKPKVEGFPCELELFSKLPDSLEGDFPGPFIPIPTDEEIESLSAILLDSGYYEFLVGGIVNIGGLPVVGPVHLIPLKARAWLDMTARKTDDSKKIKKHKRDVFRLYQIIAPDFEDEMPDQVRKDVAEFLERMPSEPLDADFDSAKLKGQSHDEVLEALHKMYVDRG